MATAVARARMAVAAAAAAATAVLLLMLSAAGVEAQTSISTDPLVVHIPGQGTVRGTDVRTYRGRRVRAWRALPYAQPPTGERRFRPPALPPPAWNGTRDASIEAPYCPQMVLLSKEYTGQEDCLFLNVFAPYGVQDLPVLVWMHGGSFVEGSGGARWSGPDYLLEQPLVFVTFNYRLGPLGFLSTGDKEAQGNYGLKDAAAALRWVRANAAAFGGKSDRVALWGYSAGAATVHLLTLSPPARGLFDAVIFGSGGATHRWALYDSPLPTARRLGELVNCTAEGKDLAAKAALNETKDLIGCLRERTAEEIVRTYYSFPSLVGDMPMPWGPVVESDPSPDDEPFLPRAPADLLDEGNVARVPAVTGIVSDEALDAAWTIFKNPQAAQTLDLNFMEALRTYAPLPVITDEIGAEIRHFYFGSLPLTAAPLENLTALFTDMFFTVESVGGAVEHTRATKQPVYFYLFSFHGRISEFVRSGLGGEPRGVMHADDLLYALDRQYPFAPIDWPNATEEVAIQRLTRLWANVAATGEPDPLGANDTLLESEWRPIEGEGDLFRHLLFDSELHEVQGPPFAERVALWKRLAKEAELFLRSTTAPPPPSSPQPVPTSRPVNSPSSGSGPGRSAAPVVGQPSPQPSSAVVTCAPAFFATLLAAALVAAAATLVAATAAGIHAPL